jgi:hypothetical protein
MRKEWQTPVLEVLDVKMTMHSTTGQNFDADYTHGTHVPTDGHGHDLTHGS